MTHRQIVLCSPVRTAIGTYKGALQDIPTVALGATVIRETVARSGLDPSQVQTVIMGQVVQAGTRMNPSRQAAIASAAQEVMLGHVDCAIAGGMENMDQAPYLMQNGRWGYRMGHARIYDSMLHDGLNDAFSGEHSGWHTEDLVIQAGISREDQDRWAERSQRRFSEAQAADRFKQEIVPVEIKSRNAKTVFDTDEHNRPDTSLDSLGKLKPAFRKDGTITAGNAPGLNSGAAAMIVADADWAAKNGLQPLARLVSYGVGAVEPGLFGLGPVPAIQQALQRAGWSINDLDRVEINEAFAAIAVALIRQTGLPEEIVNVEGGAIAHGHPIGATGAVLTTRLLHAMQRDAVNRGLVTLCIGGGQGIALALESVL